MSIESRIATNQPNSFKFSKENEAEIKRVIAKYPKGRQASAVMPLLDLAQRQHHNWIPMKAIELIASKLDMAEIRVLEVATFYTMFNLKPVGKNTISVCTNVSCMLRNSDGIVSHIEKRLKIKIGESTKDNKFYFLIKKN